MKCGILEKHGQYAKGLLVTSLCSCCSIRCIAVRNENSCCFAGNYRSAKAGAKGNVLVWIRAADLFLSVQVSSASQGQDLLWP